MKTVAQHFAVFAEMVIPPTAGDAQRAAMKHAFFGGAAALFGLLTDAADADESDDVAATRLAQLQDELYTFGRSQGTPR